MPVTHRSLLRLPKVPSFRIPSSSILLSATGLVLCAFSFPSGAGAAVPAQVLPEIVRLSYVDGDVRIMRGDDGKKVSGAEWQQAVADTPIEGGFSLTTGAGRAEIEFEDASVAYLAPNSVLMFDELGVLNGVPYSNLQLLSGTMTMRLQPEFPDEQYVLMTTQGTLRIGSMGAAFFRVQSYLDATVVTPLDVKTREVQVLTGRNWATGESVVLQDGKVQTALDADAHKQPDADGFDTWVTARLKQRDEVMTAMERESGLQAPIPGLVEMQGRGTFFDCAPYGRCWEPRDGGQPEEPATKEPTVSAMGPATTAQFVDAAFEQPTPGAQSSAAPANPQKGQQQTRPASPVERDWIFPCDPVMMRDWSQRNPASANWPQPYAWAICHSGEWTMRHRRYVWVAGPRRHHLFPVRWVKNAGRTGYVPLHPRDETGKLPLNLRYGLYETNGWKHGGVERVDYDAGKSVKVLDAPPRGWAEVPLPRLMPVSEPTLEAHELVARVGMKSLGQGELMVRPSGTTSIRFNHRTEGFSLASTEMRGGRMTTVSASFAGANRGVGVSSSSGGGFGGGGARGGSGSGGGGVRGSGGGGSAGGGGGFHGGGGWSGGGASGGGGGSHH